MRSQTVRVLGRSEGQPAAASDAYPRSVVVFDAETLDEEPVQIAVDVACAGEIERDLATGSGNVYAVIDEWQVFRLKADGEPEVRYG